MAFPESPVRFFLFLVRSDPKFLGLLLLNMPIISSSEESSEESSDSEVILIVPDEKVTKKRSWVYSYAEKVEEGNRAWFDCRYKLKSGNVCPYKVHTKDGQTSKIAKHLKEKHGLKPPTKEIQTTMDQFQGMCKPKKEKTFRRAFSELVVKQYLPFSIIEQRVLRDSYIAYYNEYVKTKTPPTFDWNTGS